MGSLASPARAVQDHVKGAGSDWPLGSALTEPHSSPQAPDLAPKEANSGGVEVR